jgi:hypothetical protein
MVLSFVGLFSKRLFNYKINTSFFSQRLISNSSNCFNYRSWMLGMLDELVNMG